MLSAGRPLLAQALVAGMHHTAASRAALLGGCGEVGGRVQGTDMECVVADDEVMLSVVTGWRANLGRN